MSVNWNTKEYQPDKVVEKIEETRQTGSDGKKVQFVGWGFEEFAALIYSMLDFSNEIPEIDAREFVSKAIFNSGEKGAITTKSLISEINRLENEYQSLPIEKFVLVSSISLSPSWEIKKIKTENALIMLDNLLPSNFYKETETLLRNAEQSLFANRPTSFLSTRVYVSAKSIHHAAAQALEILDFNRGIWNWLLNRQCPRRMSFGGKPLPVNKIILGPIHTLHKPNGKLAATEVWWYEPNYLGEIKLFSPTQDQIESLSNSFTYVRKTFNKHKYPRVIQNAFIRYTRALDERDWTTSFLKLWSILELLTDTGNMSYETTIKRTAFLYKDRDYAFQVLKHLRIFRNSSVHFDKENSETETYLYQLKSYIENLLRFHLDNKYGFETVHEAGEFLGLPYDEKDLSGQEKEYMEKLRKINLSRKFHGYI